MSEEKSFDLTKVHEVNLKLLKEIDRICRKYKIKYALDSGTLLGAVHADGEDCLCQQDIHVRCIPQKLRMIV